MTALDTRVLVETLVPMLADHADSDVPLSTYVGTHVFDEKIDGLRATLTSGDSAGQFFMRNRNGRDMTASYPDLEAGATFALPLGVVLDGEITVEGGRFEDIAKADRKRQKDVVAALDQPVLFTAFDILHHPDHGDVRNWKYDERRRLLESLDLNGHGYATTMCSPDPAFFEHIKALGGVGVVIKRLSGRYERGRNANWRKFKTVREVTCIAVGYEPGNGARAEIGAVLLAMVNEETGKSVYVGKVGSGFSESAIKSVKADLDKGLMPILEIQVLGRTKENKLRHPVFKGVRTDILTYEVRSTQLNALPQG
jgi:bifunctional non-homologous end joining protein LigD